MTTFHPVTSSPTPELRRSLNHGEEDQEPRRAASCAIAGVRIEDQGQRRAFDADERDRDRQSRSVRRARCRASWASTAKRCWPRASKASRVRPWSFRRTRIRSSLRSVSVMPASTPPSLRDAAAAFARAASRHANLATALADVASGVAPAAAAQAVTEGVLLARYRYEQLQEQAHATCRSRELTLVTSAERVEGRSVRRATRPDDGLGGDARARPGQRAGEGTDRPRAWPKSRRKWRATHGLQVEVLRQGRSREDGLRRHPRRQCRQHRAAAHGQAHLQAERRQGQGRASGDGRQGHHVRLGRHQPEAGAGHAAFHEDGHGRRRRGARCDVGAARPRLPEHGHGVPDVHRQHAVGLGHQDGRRADTAQRQDGRDPQHRRRGPPDPRRRPGARGRVEARRDHQHRHADRRDPGRRSASC